MPPQKELKDFEVHNEDKACAICFSTDRQLYNFCSNNHNCGVCLQCYSQMESDKCPFCK